MSRRHAAPLVLMTGANGFVGRYLGAAISVRNPVARIRAVDSKGGPGIKRVDVRAPDAVEALVAEARPATVIHLAAQSSVARSGENADAAETFAVNVGGSLNLAVAVARHAPAATLLFPSSAEVYGASLRDGPVTEHSALRPLSRYGQSKKLAEEVLAAILPPTARLIVARSFNHTGPGQSEDFVLPSFVGQIARIENGLQPPRLLVGNLEARRDFIDVRDVAAAYLALLEAPGVPERFVCNVGSGQPPQAIGEIVEMLKGMTKAAFEVVIDPRRLRASDIPVAEGRTELLHDVTGWTPRIRLEETLRDMLEEARLALSKEPRLDAGTTG